MKSGLKELDNPLTLLQDLSLPRTMVQRLAKGVLPPNTQIQKDALLAMSKGATVFVNYLTNTYVHSSIMNTPNLAHALRYAPLDPNHIDARPDPTRTPRAVERRQYSPATCSTL